MRQVNHCLPGSSTPIDYEKSILLDMSIGDRLKELRQPKDGQKLSQEAFGALVGTTKQYVSQLENGVNQTPNGLFLEGWARHFGVRLQWLATGELPKLEKDAPASQAVGLDPIKLANSIEMLKKAFGMRGLEFNAEYEAELISIAYDYLVASPKVADFDGFVKGLVRGRHVGQREDGSTVEEVAGAARRKVAS